MKKFIIVTYLAFLVPILGTAQQSAVKASWTPEHTIVLPSADLEKNVISLPVSTSLPQSKDLNEACRQMSGDFTTWKVDAAAGNFIITLHKETQPTWTTKDWQTYLNRLSSAFLTNNKKS